MPSAGVRASRSSSSRRARWAAIAKRPYSTNEPGSTRSATFSRAVRPPAAWRRSTASGRASSSVNARRASTSARSARSFCSSSGTRGSLADGAASARVSGRGSLHALDLPLDRRGLAPVDRLAVLLHLDLGVPGALGVVLVGEVALERDGHVTRDRRDARVADVGARLVEGVAGLRDAPGRAIDLGLRPPALAL